MKKSFVWLWKNNRQGTHCNKSLLYLWCEKVITVHCQSYALQLLRFVIYVGRTLLPQLFKPVYFQMQGVWGVFFSYYYVQAIVILVFNANSVDAGQTPRSICGVWRRGLRRLIWPGSVCQIAFLKRGFPV